ncbi:hypothetical protein AVEN_183347-1 [Araneus ventricosus]|uniref:Transposable element Tc1 transposase n=1 Tax=Araneus ventricosus TaxID=182803 RepID=A0A4Y2PWG1_ARAVE|nr:hypothetical protein AVEN_183347-1 [Araneus ventricosus]
MTCKFCNWVGRRDVSELTNQRAPLFSLVRIEVKVGYMLPGQDNTGILEDWKRVAWSDESQFRLLHADGRLRIWCQAHEAMDPACQIGTVQGHGVSIVVWGGSFWDLWYLYHPLSIRFGT